ncbi:M20 aminoacylase family protein [Thioclava atlantica]|uniref:Hippurate hydrolase n=1 Tax=Thioclava atlantica TaxID=1317124 RepID=A0A085TTR8_9RHOB|nr:M20 aminoacylase family protein [Thioclava atlantica]KFE34115.1 hippurate hydrolase [Thioclava atlantica]
MPIKNRFAEMLPEAVEWRHDFHRNPELLYDLPRTSARVADLLRAFGCDEVVEGIGRSGVVGVIAGTGARASGPRVIGLRADMDALPVREKTGAPHASEVPGKMHACGHDGHTATLLSAAKYLCETRAFAGRAVVIFQPAEEGGAGAREMIRDGLMERFGIEEVYALHNMPGMAPGSFGIRPGAMMAAADFFEITLEGKGGHAAKPQETVDPVPVAAHLILALQSIVARAADPLQEIVLSVTTLESDSQALNVIGNSVKLGGTVRTMSAETRDLAETRLREIAQGVAATHNARASVDYRRGYPVTRNDPERAEAAAQVAEAVAGEVDRMVDPMMGAEDFAYMLEARPGAYGFIGNGDSAPLHHAQYDFNDAILPAGASWFVGLVEARLAAE